MGFLSTAKHRFRSRVTSFRDPEQIRFLRFGWIVSRREDSVIHSRKDTMSGMPVFKGTRVVVKNLFDYLASGYQP